MSGKESSYFLDKKHINDIQVLSIDDLIKLCKQCHFVDIKLRLNGEDIWRQADWIKHLKKVEK